MGASNRLRSIEGSPSEIFSERPRVCVVNDDRAVRVSLKFVFRAADFDVRAFTSGRGLIASPATRIADCFVLDHKPRGADGLQLARRLRRIGLSAPIVLTTGFRCAPFDMLASNIEAVIPAVRVDEELIQRLLVMIAAARGAGLRNIP